MGIRLDTTFTERTSLESWDFGDFPYALEPLTLPVPGMAPLAAGDPPQGDFAAVCRELRAFTGAWDTPVEADPFQSYDRLFWFRWITGHQLTFAVWQLMGRLIKPVAERGQASAAELDALTAYTHGYCAMLLYTGSCPRPVYTGLIRPSMFLQHPGFSGTWAPDFGPVRALFRGRPQPWTDGPEAAGLRAAVETHKTIHDGIAAKLVPSGRSLLQQSMSETSVKSSAKTAVLYDNYFLTLRAPTRADRIVDQLLRRLRAVALDVAANDLYPLGHGVPRMPAEYGQDEVIACEYGLFKILSRVGETAAGLVPAHT
ncbi:hypothetical protein DPM19_23680 [Actinomadura craniellae]|uniref:L-tyrosine 3-hydroxylase n=1 Tax=Actinomadura craniellae TaxID=2231787 RepID=A0A365H0I9_9ACTN|nr:hypothetical protein [Actinomadura craniellae]RAY12604.1 hypothetical protein DPM19_23680 [Actinomadura craniellae]